MRQQRRERANESVRTGAQCKRSSGQPKQQPSAGVVLSVQSAGQTSWRLSHCSRPARESIAPRLPRSHARVAPPLKCYALLRLCDAAARVTGRLERS